MWWVVAALAGLVLGAGDQALGSLTPISWTWNYQVAEVSATWLVLPFVVGMYQRTTKRAAIAGALSALTAVAAYCAMILSPMEGVHLSASLVQVVDTVYSQLPWFLGASTRRAALRSSGPEVARRALADQLHRSRWNDVPRAGRTCARGADAPRQEHWDCRGPLRSPARLCVRSRLGAGEISIQPLGITATPECAVTTTRSGGTGVPLFGGRAGLNPIRRVGGYVPTPRDGQ